ncbi:hypothetical protein AB1Y20_011763 [Prymnesium parvum]|uniref:SHOCT domain-containing protein n=1 Tax=Prymnesium parvum TaxID=97485 RepID=A0AB34IKC0_PRYPA
MEMAAVGKSHGIMGNASREDIELAKGLLGPGETLIGVWRISETNKSTAAKQPLALLLLPCFWCHFLVCSPCICFAYRSHMVRLSATVYALSDRNFYKTYDESLTNTPCVCTAGRDVGAQPLHLINSVGQDLPATGCCAGVCPTTGVVLGVPPGSILANAGGGKHIPASSIHVLIDDTKEFAEKVRELQSNLMGVPQYGMGPQYGMAMQGQGQGSSTPYSVVAGSVVPAEMSRDDDHMAKLKSLKELYDAGVLTASEFEAKKAEILKRL